MGEELTEQRWSIVLVARLRDIAGMIVGFYLLVAFYLAVGISKAAAGNLRLSDLAPLITLVVVFGVAPFVYVRNARLFIGEDRVAARNALGRTHTCARSDIAEVVLTRRTLTFVDARGRVVLKSSPFWPKAALNEALAGFDRVTRR